MEAIRAGHSAGGGGGDAGAAAAAQQAAGEARQRCAALEAELRRAKRAEMKLQALLFRSLLFQGMEGGAGTAALL